MKPGWQTSEFWIALVGQLLALLALSGAINVADKDKLETALANAVTAIFAIVSSAVVVIRYIRSRSELKSQAPSAPPEQRPLILPCALIGCFLLAAPLQAAPPAKPACFHQRQQRADPAVVAALQQIAQNQQTIITLLQQQQRTPAPAQPLVLVAPLPQTIPPGGPARQDIPLGGAPRQEIPLGGAPRQDIPLGQPPRQEVPLGPAPRQSIPLGEVKPPMAAPGETKPAPAQSYLPR